MEEFEVKRGSTKDLASRIPIELSRHFGCEPEPRRGRIRDRLRCDSPADRDPRSRGKTLRVEIETDPSVDDDAVILDTIRKRNAFLEGATGFSSKERVKRSKKKVGS